MEGTIEIICPLYNAEKYIKDLHKSILLQKKVCIKRIHYILTRSKDNSESILNSLNIDFDMIEPEYFSHSLTREKAAMESDADILVFITQDIKVERDDWLWNLTKDIKSDLCEATYSRQICDNNSIEKYTREKNYPNKSIIKTKKSIEELGLYTFFFSDASSAISTKVFKIINGYDSKLLPINEDMYIAYKIIQNGYCIKYCADSVVSHSHVFVYSEIYNRYKLTGEFFKNNQYLDQYGTLNSGYKLAIYIFKRIIEDRNIKALLQFIPNMCARILGMKAGKING